MFQLALMNFKEFEILDKMYSEDTNIYLSNVIGMKTTLIIYMIYV